MVLTVLEKSAQKDHFKPHLGPKCLKNANEAKAMSILQLKMTVMTYISLGKKMKIIVLIVFEKSAQKDHLKPHLGPKCLKKANEAKAMSILQLKMTVMTYISAGKKMKIIVVTVFEKLAQKGHVKPHLGPKCLKNANQAKAMSILQLKMTVMTYISAGKKRK